MKHSENPGVGQDADGTLFDPRVRTAMARFAGQDTAALEAAAAVRSAAHAVERLRGQGTDNRGLSSGALDLLLQLSAEPDRGITIGALARAAGVSARNVTGLVDTLERNGLAERVPDRADRRSVLARITPAGQQWLTAFREPTRVAMGAVFRGFTQTELTQLRHLCLRLVTNQQAVEQHMRARPQP